MPKLIMDRKIPNDSLRAKKKSNPNKRLERKSLSSVLRKKRSKLKNNSETKSKHSSSTVKNALIQYEYQMKSRLTWEYADIFGDVKWCESLVGEDTESKPIKIEPLHTKEEAADELSIEKIKRLFLENQTELTIENTPAALVRSTTTSNNTVMKYSGAPINKHFGDVLCEATHRNSPQTDDGCSTGSSDDKCYEKTFGGTESSTKVLDIISPAPIAHERTSRLRRFHKTTSIIGQHSVVDTPAADTDEVNTNISQKTSYHEENIHVSANNSNNNPIEQIHNDKKKDMNQINVKNEVQGTDRNNHDKTKKEPFRCSCCQKGFSQRSSLTIHQRVHSKEKPFNCTECPQKFSQNGDLKRHQRIHTGERPYKCKECPKMFSRSSYLTKHKRVHSGEKPYKCAECPKMFSQRGSLALHQRIHSGEKPYTCTECPKMFAQRIHLKRHQCIHSGEKPYKCTECPMMCSSNGDLTKHKRVHSGEKPYKCAECPKMFSTSSYLKIHQRYHSGEKPYKCTECPQKFSQNGDLKRHQRIHTGKRPYKCEECPKIFARCGSLTIHKLAHSGEKPYKCTECPKMFSQRGSLALHQRIHSREKPYKCTECPKMFAQRIHLKRHQHIHLGEKYLKISG